MNKTEFRNLKPKDMVILGWTVYEVVESNKRAMIDGLHYIVLHNHDIKRLVLTEEEAICLYKVSDNG